MINNVEHLERTIENNADLTFEEYKEMREPSYNAIINDYAVKLVERAKENGEDLSIADAKARAKNEIPLEFIPEWMRNLRINANIAGTELIYLEEIASQLGRIEEILSAVFERQIDEYIRRHSKDFKREDA